MNEDLLNRLTEKLDRAVTASLDGLGPGLKEIIEKEQYTKRRQMDHLRHQSQKWRRGHPRPHWPYVRQLRMLLFREALIVSYSTNVKFKLDMLRFFENGVSDELKMIHRSLL